MLFKLVVRNCRTNALGECIDQSPIGGEGYDNDRSRYQGERDSASKAQIISCSVLLVASVLRAGTPDFHTHGICSQS